MAEPQSKGTQPKPPEVFVRMPLAEFLNELSGGTATPMLVLAEPGARIIDDNTGRKPATFSLDVL